MEQDEDMFSDDKVKDIKDSEGKNEGGLLDEIDDMGDIFALEKEENLIDKLKNKNTLFD
jgi:hypothetical protein